MICFVDYRTSDEELLSLKNLNLEIIKIPKSNKLYEAIDGHTDIQLNIVDKASKTIIINKDLPKTFKDNLSKNKINFVESKLSLTNKYPGNIFLNSLILPKYFIHNIQYSDPNLLKLVNEKTFINVKQGYTKCSILPLNETAFITNDKGIFNQLSPLGFDILLLPFGDIILPGFEYGFIGGVGGMISEKELAFFGSLDHYKYGEQVKNFLKKYNIKPIYLKNDKLTDRGSLFVL